jgi:SAM-dependent methyltransferase
MTSKRAEHEIRHGQKLAQADPEQIWGWGTPAGRQRAKRRGALIAQGAQLGPGIRALEIGCGTGLFTEMFAQTGAHLIAVDISSDLLEQAKGRGLPPDRVRFLAKPFEACEVDGPFDAVIGSSILHHLEVTPALKQIYSLLKPGGVLSFAEPNMLNPQIMVQKNIPWIKARLGDSPDETAFVRWRFQALLTRLGFENIRITPFDWLHPATPEPWIDSVKWIGRHLEHSPGLREFAGSLHIRAYRPHH